MPQVLRTRTASRDLDGIWDYIAEDNLSAADRLLDQINDRCELLAGNPLLGQACPALAPSLRQFAVGNYVIYYRPLDDDILIVRVLHGARNIPEVFEREPPDV